MHADRRQASLGLHLLMEFVEALAIAVHIEISDGPGHRFQMVDHRANIAIGARPLAFGLLNRKKTCLINGGVDVPPVLREAPLCRCPLQEIDEFRAVLRGPRLRGQECAPLLSTRYTSLGQKETELTSTRSKVASAKGRRRCCQQRNFALVPMLEKWYTPSTLQIL